MVHVQGILPHIDLLKFGDEVLGISLGAAEMIFRRIKAELLPVQPGGAQRHSKDVKKCIKI